MKQPSRVANFDRVAHIYRWAEYLTLGPLLQRTRTHFISQVSACRKAWVLGDGDGRFLSALLTKNHQIQATVIDTSACMLKLLRERCSHEQSRVQTLCASALDTAPPLSTDVVITHFFLDCLDQSEVNALIERVAATCQAGTLWLVSDFQVPANSWLRWLARGYIRLLYLAFRLLTGLHVQHLPDTRAAFLRSGFQRSAYHQTLAGILYTEIWQLARR